MNPDLTALHPYPFQRLAALLAEVEPASVRPLVLSIGEPQHPPPDFCGSELNAHLDRLTRYPATAGGDELREAIAQWLTWRFALPGVDAKQEVLVANGTREALFAIAQCVIDKGKNPLVAMPNPGYQIYEGAAILAGAEPYYLNGCESARFHPDWHAVPDAIWQRCQLLYLCTPGNPTGAVMSLARLREVIELADRFDFVIASDECYSEIYYAEPPPGLLQACAAMGRDRYERCLVFNSLSKRSNLPGLRSGFIAGDRDLIRGFLTYRTYHGGAMPGPNQGLSVACWRDEQHVIANRRRYQQKLNAIIEHWPPGLRQLTPEGGFFLWPAIGQDDELVAQELFARHNVKTLPGRYLARDAHGQNPGAGRLRLALVGDDRDCIAALARLSQCLAERDDTDKRA